MKKVLTVGKATKVFIVVVILIILFNAIYFGFHWNVFLGVALALITVGLIPLFVRFIKSNKPNGRWW